MQGLSRHLSTVALGPLLLLGGTAVHAQEGFGDIIVTAQKRETLLEKTPMTINVVSGDQLGELGVVEIKGLAANVPGLSLHESPGGLSGVSIRGVGTSAGSQVFEQSVGLFVDGVYHPRARQYRDSLFDIARVEVIKGSQGVLFGKNTSVGAVSVVTRDPGTRTGGHVQGQVEANYGKWSLEGGLDIVATDTLSFRVAGLYESDPGYIRNLALDRKEPSGDRHVLRAVAVWEPADGLRVRAKVQTSRMSMSGTSFEFLGNQNVAGLQALGVLDGGLTNYTKYENNGAGDYQKSWDPSLEISYEFDSGYSITSISGYSGFNFQNSFDSDSTPQPFLMSTFNEDFDQFTQEIRLASPTGRTLEFIVGGFYLHSTVKYDYISNYNGFPVLGGLYGKTSQKFDQTENAFAGFGQLTWHMADNLQLNLGGRFSTDTKDADYEKSLLDDNGYPNNLVSILTVGSGTSKKITDDTFDFSATLSYNPTESSTLYASVGQGNKGSGFVNQSALALPFPDPFLIPVEKVTTFEAGFKGRFLDGRGYVSIAAYHLDIKDYQDSFYNAEARAFQVRSLDAKSTGVEAEARFQLADWLSAYGNLAFNPTAELDNGERMQRSPRFTSTLGARFNADLDQEFNVGGFVQWVHSDAMLHQPASAPGDNWSLPSDLLSARLQVTHIPSDFSVYVTGSNLTKNVYRTFVFGSPIGMGMVGALNEPRMITIGVRKNF
ncbi:TonB-dependent receptor [Sandaracinobacteroides sp. A072]|uniref:TonB-dependent receptor n=1 Tax=Sandaracinobacteroides sp. A072 TaxID=3461146 RepID=UPI0040437CF0